MEQLVDLDTVRTKAMELANLAAAYLTSIDFLWQVGAVVAAGALAWILGPRLKRLILRLVPGARFSGVRRMIAGTVGEIAVSGLWFIFCWAIYAVAAERGIAHNVLRIAVNLLGAWVVIRAGTRLVRDALIANTLLVIAWSVAALNILGLLNPVLAQLNALGFSLGDQSITGLTVLKGIVALALLLWAALAASRFANERIRHFGRLTPTLQILFGKIVQFCLIALAILFALQVVGIPLTAFAIFGGAIGVGIGLGLQRAAANLISGLMLLMDKSIQPGDVVSIGETFGWVTSLGGRYVGVRTRDGIEHLVPNEVFVTQGVENWSIAARAVRLKLPFGISYQDDPRAAMALAVEAAGEVSRVLKDPPSVCNLMAFGASALELELRIWINDPQNGVSNVKSDIYLCLLERLKAAGIEIPCAQHEIHVRAPVAVMVQERASAQKSAPAVPIG
jgi:small-conductance mechanosensitive channel